MPSCSHLNLTCMKTQPPDCSAWKNSPGSLSPPRPRSFSFNDSHRTHTASTDAPLYCSLAVPEGALSRLPGFKLSCRNPQSAMQVQAGLGQGDGGASDPALPVGNWPHLMGMSRRLRVGQFSLDPAVPPGTHLSGTKVTWKAF